jgi:ABC-type antimicrobial peptide transport system permease subunit
LLLAFFLKEIGPSVYIGAAVLMAAIGIGACWIPARRASRIDPAITMRSSPGPIPSEAAIGTCD